MCVDDPMMLFRRLLFGSLMAIACGTGLCAQTVEWIARPPRLGRGLYMGMRAVVVDTARGIAYADSWERRAVMRSSGRGHVWRGEYAPENEVVNFARSTVVLAGGELLLYGLRVTRSLVAYVSEDGGVTWRFLSTDTMLVKTDGSCTIQDIVPPGHVVLRADEPDGREYVSSDAGRTWRALDRTAIPVSSRYTVYPAPAVRAAIRDGVWWTMDVRRDTVWTATDVPEDVSTWFALGEAFVGLRGGVLVWRGGPGRPVVRIDSVDRPGFGTGGYGLTVIDLKRISDSVVIAVDHSGLVVKITDKGEVITVIDAGTRSDRFSLVYDGLQHAGSTTYLAWDLHDREPTYPAPSRRLEVFVRSHTGRIGVYQRPARFEVGHVDYGLAGDSLLFVQREDNVVREVLRSTDDGESWWLPDSIVSETLTPGSMGFRSSLRTASGVLLMQSDRDQCIRQSDTGFRELRHAYTDAAVWNAAYGAPYWLEDVKHRHPVPAMVDDRAFVPSSVLSRIDPTTGAPIDTVLAHPVSFVQRIGPSRLVAARDSLWLSDDVGLTWRFVPVSVPSVADSIRGSISDVREQEGRLFCALRGYSGAANDGVPEAYRYGGMVVSDDDGATWHASPGWPSAFPHVAAITTLGNGVLAAHASRVMIDTTITASGARASRAVIEEAGLFRSTDNGETWVLVRQDGVSSLRYPDADPSFLYLREGHTLAITYGGRLIESFDGGASWDFVPEEGLGLAQVRHMVDEGSGRIRLSTTHGIAMLGIGSTSVSPRASAASPLDVRLTRDGRLEVHTDHGARTVAVYDLLGRCWRSVVADGPVTTVDLVGLAPGAHIVTATFGNRTERAMIVVP